MLGILLIRKEPGYTSHDVVAKIRHKLGTRRVGHAGTLDPLATGLLVVAVGPATRFLQYLPLEPKEYIGTIRFGIETSTYDLEGEVVAEKPVPGDLEAQIGDALPKFRGLIQQYPPLYSAVKKDGKPLYQYARQGKDVEREPRTVHIGSFDILEVNGPDVKVKIECSGGTYVRSLAHDIGQVVGCGATLAELERTRVGRFRLEQACKLDSIKPSNIIPLREALPPMQLLHLNDIETDHIREGRSVGLKEPANGDLVGLIEPNGEVFSVARVKGNVLQPECVIPKMAT